MKLNILYTNEQGGVAIFGNNLLLCQLCELIMDPELHGKKLVGPAGWGIKFAQPAKSNQKQPGRRAAGDALRTCKKLIIDVVHLFWGKFLLFRNLWTQNFLISVTKGLKTFSNLYGKWQRKCGCKLGSLGDFGGLSRHCRKVGWTWVAAEGTAGAIWTGLRILRGLGLVSRGLSSIKANTGVMRQRVEINDCVSVGIRGVGIHGMRVVGRHLIIILLINLQNPREEHKENKSLQGTQGITFRISFRVAHQQRVVKGTELKMYLLGVNFSAEETKESQIYRKRMFSSQLLGFLSTLRERKIKLSRRNKRGKNKENKTIQTNFNNIWFYLDKIQL
ncbi:hypothetical protein VP01_1903g3 [Puccinia sorghi]|uniref:Uncharacterized protein n=1 Tax=Puccinia sorghi TaxID=27349 RepID=A0A0L6VEN7_9BASI|nr:hypothetical protein VP01_1903g3 [Puccinia sorghi]